MLVAHGRGVVGAVVVMVQCPATVNARSLSLLNGGECAFASPRNAVECAFASH